MPYYPHCRKTHAQEVTSGTVSTAYPNIFQRCALLVYLLLADYIFCGYCLRWLFNSLIYRIMDNIQQLELFRDVTSYQMPCQGFTKLFNKVEKKEVKEPKMVVIPTLKVHPSSVTLYNEICWNPHRPSRSSSGMGINKEFRVHKHLLRSSRSADGEVSSIARRKIVRAIEYLLFFASNKYVEMPVSGRSFNFKIAFITLTLPSPQVHDDNTIKRKCLNSMLIELKKYEGVKNFVWRAELQQNGNIHFHIVIDKFVHWNDLRDRWNRIINKLGYVDRYRDRMKEYFKDGFRVREDLVSNWPAQKQRAAYKRNIQTDYHSPNSTDIHSIKKINNIKAYFIKYMTKTPERATLPSPKPADYRKLQGRLWGSSESFQGIRGCSVVLDSEVEQEIRDIISESSCKCYHSDYFSVFNIKFSDLRLGSSRKIFSEFCKYLLEEFEFSVQNKLSI